MQSADYVPLAPTGNIALTSGLTRKQVASDLGVGFSTLSKWIQKSKPDDLPFVADIDRSKEVERLRKENRLLVEERDLLKKNTENMFRWSGYAIF